MTIYNVVLGGYATTVDIELDGKGGFTGSININLYGLVPISNGVVSGISLSGAVILDGYNGRFNANISGSRISGSVNAGQLMNQTFTGTLAT